ncbi:Uncharacterized protein TCM_008151 [Theobroma cacao]|uniref:Uncharacterized protein n=1 Tax=Theobroma cacao TaxID=3641 RepID=A0A061E4A5_THECC|nr:Uncharacterized protein TCM_008151 [Theobroma cacao]
MIVIITDETWKSFLGMIFRDHMRFVLGIYSENTGTEDSNLAEFYAIHESDSLNAISWVNNHNKAPWRMKNILNALEVYLLNSVGISFNNIIREAHTLAGGLAKAGGDKSFKLQILLSEPSEKGD